MRSIFVCVLLFALMACGGKQTRKTLTPEVPQSGNAEARSRFQEAKTAFLRDGTQSEQFERIVEEYPDDPIVPWANLYAGIAAIKERRFEDAAKSLKAVLDADVPPQLTARAQLFLGITTNYQGDAAGALRLLEQGKNAVEEVNRTEFIAAVAYATAVVDPVSSLPAFDELYPRVSKPEQALIVARLEEVVAAAPPEALRRVFDQLGNRKGPATAVAGSRLVILAEQRGNAAEAQGMRETVVAARKEVGLPATITATVVSGGGGKSGLVGAVMPLGKSRAGDAALAGLGLASGASGGVGVAAFEVRSAGTADEAALAVGELAKQDVVAVIGPIDGASVDRAAGRAEGLGLPLLSLSGRPEERAGGRFVFHMRHSAEARARVLARRAKQLGVTKFAMLAPQDKYGESVGAAFADEVRKGGGTIIKTETYAPGTKSFVGVSGKLASASWEALFIPEEARTLAQITPNLSAKKLIPKPWGTKTARGGRPILLLSTAEDLSGEFVADAGKHSEGALFAPGFYPDADDPTHRPFIDRFLAAFGRAPGVVEAYAYDAAQLAAAAGSSGRTGLASLLATGTTTGITGAIKFDADHRRADPGVLYHVVEDNGAFAIRVVK